MRLTCSSAPATFPVCNQTWQLNIHQIIVDFPQTSMYWIPRRTLRHFFLPSAPRQPHRHFHPEVCKTRQIYIDVGIFISRCFLCSDIILCLGIFTQKLGGKTRNLGGKKWNLAEFCSKHFSALNNMTRPYTNLSASAFFLGLGIYSGNRQK